MPKRIWRSTCLCIVFVFMVSCVTSPSTLPTARVSVPTQTKTPVPTPEPTAIPIPKPNDYIVIAQLNLGYHGPGCYGGFEQFNCSGKRSTALFPALGTTYDSADRSVIKQQIDWAASYRIDAFSLEWTTPRGVGNSLEDILEDNFLKAPNLNKIRWCIFYDLELRIRQDSAVHVDLSNGMNFDNPDVYNTFISDFDQAQYLNIDNRPEVYIWGVWNAIGNFARAFQESRKKAADQGYEVYIVGDIIRTDVFNAKLAAAYDANTNFLFLIPGLGDLSGCWCNGSCSR